MYFPKPEEAPVIHTTLSSNMTQNKQLFITEKGEILIKSAGFSNWEFIVPKKE